MYTTFSILISNLLDIQTVFAELQKQLLTPASLNAHVLIMTISNLSTLVTRFVSNLSTLEKDDLKLGFEKSSDFILRQIVKQRIGLSDLSKLLCCCAEKISYPPSNEIWQQTYSLHCLEIEYDLNKEFDRMVEVTNFEINNRLLHLPENLSLDKVDINNTLISNAEKIFWQQEANSLAGRLNRSLTDAKSLEIKLQEAQLQADQAIQNITELDNSYKRRLQENSELLAILIQCPSNEKVLENITKKSDETINNAQATVKKAKEVAKEVFANSRPALLSKIFKNQ